MPTLKKENLLVNTFGTSSEEAVSSDIVQLNKKGFYSNLHLALTAYVVPMICSPLQKQPVKFAVDSYSHREALQLPDDGNLVSIPEIDILVGAYFCRHIFTSNVQETKLSCVVSGPVVHESRNNDDTSTNLIATHFLKMETIETPRTVSFVKN